METKRQLDVLDQHLAQNEFLAPGGYSIADMAVWPWYGWLVLGKLYEAAEFVGVDSYTHVQRWANTIAERPAVVRGQMVNRAWGDPAGQLHERHAASDFDTSTQDKIGDNEPAKS